MKRVEALSAKKYAPADAFLKLLLVDGKHLAVDDARALTLARRAENVNSPLTLLVLALIYQEGRGVAKDGVQALTYYKEASTAEIPAAQEWLAARGEKHGNLADAKRYYKLCAAQALKSCKDKWRASIQNKALPADLSRKELGDQVFIVRPQRLLVGFGVAFGI